MFRPLLTINYFAGTICVHFSCLLGDGKKNVKGTFSHWHLHEGRDELVKLKDSFHLQFHFTHGSFAMRGALVVLLLLSGVRYPCIHVFSLTR